MLQTGEMGESHGEVWGEIWIRKSSKRVSHFYDDNESDFNWKVFLFQKKKELEGAWLGLKQFWECLV